MAFCPNCGKEIDAAARFCPSCGVTMSQAPANQAPAAGPNPVMTGPMTQAGVQRNVAGLLCYVLGFITGGIFLAIEKDRWVRFHAWQSIVVFGAIFVVDLVLQGIRSAMPWGLWTIMSLLISLVNLVSFGLWVLLMYKAYNNEAYKLPIAGDYAERLNR